MIQTLVIHAVSFDLYWDIRTAFWFIVQTKLKLQRMPPARTVSSRLRLLEKSTTLYLSFKSPKQLEFDLLNP